MLFLLKIKKNKVTLILDEDNLHENISHNFSDEFKKNNIICSL